MEYFSLFLQGRKMSLLQQSPGPSVASWAPFVWWQVQYMVWHCSAVGAILALIVEPTRHFGCIWKGQCDMSIMVSHLTGMYLVVITKKRNVGSLLGHAVWKAVDFDVISYKKTVLHLTETQVTNLLYYTIHVLTDPPESILHSLWSKPLWILNGYGLCIVLILQEALWLMPCHATHTFYAVLFSAFHEENCIGCITGSSDSTVDLRYCTDHQLSFIPYCLNHTMLSNFS